MHRAPCAPSTTTKTLIAIPKTFLFYRDQRKGFCAQVISSGRVLGGEECQEWQWAGARDVMPLASEWSLLVSAQGCQGEGVTDRLLMCTSTPPTHSTAEPVPLSMYILVFLHKGVFRERDQREFPPCKITHPFSSSK